MTKRSVIAVTGATGFVGRHLVGALLADGHSVKALVRPQSIDKVTVCERLEWIQGGLNDSSALTSLCANADTVIHLAGLTTARTKDAYFKTNAQAAGQLTAIAKAAGVRRFIYLSSLAAREPALSDYAASKRAGEGAMARRLGDMAGVAIRAPAVFGAGDKATKPIFDMIKRGFLPCPGGRNWRSRTLSLIDVDDLVEFIKGPCLRGEHDGKTVSPATAASLTWPEFAAACTTAMGKRVKPLPLPLSVLYPAAGAASITKRVFGKGHLTLGKLREFLHADWSVDAQLISGTDLQFALKKTINAA